MLGLLIAIALTVRPQPEPVQLSLVAELNLEGKEVGLLLMMIFTTLEAEPETIVLESYGLRKSPVRNNYWGETYGIDCRTWKKVLELDIESYETFHECVAVAKEGEPIMIVNLSMKTISLGKRVRKQVRSMVNNSTLYWFTYNMYLYGYDLIEKRWFQSKCLKRKLWTVTPLSRLIRPTSIEKAKQRIERHYKRRGTVASMATIGFNLHEKFFNCLFARLYKWYTCVETIVLESYGLRESPVRNNYWGETYGIDCRTWKKVLELDIESYETFHECVAVAKEGEPIMIKDEDVVMKLKSGAKWQGEGLSGSLLLGRLPRPGPPHQFKLCHRQTAEVLNRQLVDGTQQKRQQPFCGNIK
ncbi:hypothetical protein RND71_015460 [Anisodus tanguticus]|uniref:Uncharacterized protein n=1 Tax=Anisodus tanguticus TaxID=243964 RepID=A0AAE1VCW8_9SOLA|nr:hypothetical protein RND71_015460 [Anisodus tanguticus]